MKLIENMTLAELERELAQQTAIYNKALTAIEAVHGERDYSDEVAKHFHLGMVGFRKDRKKVERSLNHALDNATRACDLYERRDEADHRIARINQAIACIRLSGMLELTEAQVKSQKRQSMLDAAPILEWERKNGGYASGEVFVKKIDANFVVIEIGGKRLDRWYRTVREAKSVAAILLSKRRATQAGEVSL